MHGWLVVVLVLGFHRRWRSLGVAPSVDCYERLLMERKAPVIPWRQRSQNELSVCRAYLQLSPLKA